MTHGEDRKWCPSCHVRFRVEPLSLNDYNAVNVTTSQLQRLELAARHFDEMSDRNWSAVDFIRWLRPDVPGTPEYEALRRALPNTPESKKRDRVADGIRRWERYHSDPDYRERILARNRLARQRAAS